MTATNIVLHRVVSWWLAVFSAVTIVLGYAIARHWVTNETLYTRIHMIFEWAFISLVLFHIIYTLIFVKIRSRKLIVNPKRHWIRLVQQATKWLIVIFVTLLIIAGFQRYEWIPNSFASGIPFRYHRLFDVFLVLAIIIHVMTGAKIFFNRKKIKGWWINVLILVIGGLLIAGTIYLEVTRSLLTVI
jgi:hypothetical protein